MTIVSGMDKLVSLRAIGRYGTKKGQPRDGQNWEQIVEANPRAGIYQIKVTKQGRKISKMKFYYPTNPRTGAQQAWRLVFKNGREEWATLTQAQQKQYNERAKRKKYTGYNLFLSEYLTKHR